VLFVYSSLCMHAWMHSIYIKIKQIKVVETMSISKFKTSLQLFTLALIQVKTLIITYTSLQLYYDIVTTHWLAKGNKENRIYIKKKCIPPRNQYRYRSCVDRTNQDKCIAVLPGKDISIISGPLIVCLCLTGETHLPIMNSLLET